MVSKGNTGNCVLMNKIPIDPVRSTGPIDLVRDLK